MEGVLMPFSNYLVPAAGYVQGYKVDKDFSVGVPETLDFRVLGLDGVKFSPYGVYISNQGAGTLSITIEQTGQSITCAAGGSIQQSYLGPVEQSVIISGNGRAIITFVNFPII